jgi:hypothetical protein
MIPRKPTQADCEFWGDGATVAPMLGRHVGAADIEVIRHPDGKVRVPWVVDERDDLHGLREGLTVWTTFWGGRSSGCSRRRGRSASAGPRAASHATRST